MVTANYSKQEQNQKTMNTFTKTLALILLSGATTILFVGCASDSNEQRHGAASAKPYPLNKCIVTDEGFEHGKPYTFVHDGQQIKLCCKDCLADFKKDPAKYLAKLGPAK